MPQPGGMIHDSGVGKYRVPIHDEIDGEPDDGYVEFDDLETAKAFAASIGEEVQDVSGTEQDGVIGFQSSE